MKSKSVLRLEWISLVYLALFVLAVLSPSLVSRRFFGIEERHIEEVLIFLFGIVGMATFSVYERLMEVKDREHEDAKSEYERARKELVESYRYIGSVNRKIEVLKGLTNQLFTQVGEGDRATKELLSALLANAANSIGAPYAFLRYVRAESSRTEHEMSHGNESLRVKVSNKNLIRLQSEGVQHAFIRSEDGKEVLVVPAAHEGRDVRAFLLLITNPDNGMEVDTSLLKVFANQAGLLYYAQEGDRAVAMSSDPIALIERTERSAVGEVK